MSNNVSEEKQNNSNLVKPTPYPVNLLAHQVRVFYSQDFRVIEIEYALV